MYFGFKFDNIIIPKNYRETVCLRMYVHECVSEWAKEFLLPNDIYGLKRARLARSFMTYAYEGEANRRFQEERHILSGTDRVYFKKKKKLLANFCQKQAKRARGIENYQSAKWREGVAAKPTCQQRYRLTGPARSSCVDTRHTIWRAIVSTHCVNL